MGKGITCILIKALKLTHEVVECATHEKDKTIQLLKALQLQKKLSKHLTRQLMLHANKNGGQWRRTVRSTNRSPQAAELAPLRKRQSVQQRRQHLLNTDLDTLIAEQSNHSGAKKERRGAHENQERRLFFKDEFMSLG